MKINIDWGVVYVFLTVFAASLDTPNPNDGRPYRVFYNVVNGLALNFKEIGKHA